MYKRSALGRIDDSTEAQLQIDYAHHEVHEGNRFVAIYSATKNAAESINISFVTPATSVSTKNVHMYATATSSGSATFYILEGSTVTDDTGTAATPVNKNRGSSTESIIIDTSSDPDASNRYGKDVTVTVDGTTLYQEEIGSGVFGGGLSRNEGEFVLKANTRYVFKLTSNAATNRIVLLLDWYEHADIS